MCTDTIPAVVWRAVAGAAVINCASAMSFVANNQDQNDHLSAELYLTASAKGGSTNPKNVPAVFDPSLLLAGCFFALVGLFLALASQRERRLHSGQPAQSGRSSSFSSPTTGRKVRWQLGSAGADAAEAEDGDDVDAQSIYINHGQMPRGHKKNSPSYDGMYWNAGMYDDPPTPPHNSNSASRDGWAS